VTLKTDKEGGIVNASRIVSRQDHDIQSIYLRPSVAEAFPDQTLQAVSINGPSNTLLRDRQTNASIPQSIRAKEHGEILIGRSLTLAKYRIEVGCDKQPAITTEIPGDSYQRESWARPLARRLFRMRRPPRVAILARKPWVRLRLMRLG
jgi:hypothetical protein